MAVLYLIVYTINHPIFPSVYEWTYKLWYHHAVEHERVRRSGVPFRNMEISETVESQTFNLKEYMFWDSMHLKFKIKQNQPVAGEIRIMAYLWWRWWFWHSVRGASGTFLSLIFTVVSEISSFCENSLTVPLRYVCFSICVLDFNKMTKLDKSRKHKLNLHDCPPK